MTSAVSGWVSFGHLADVTPLIAFLFPFFGVLGIF